MTEREHPTTCVWRSMSQVGEFFFHHVKKEFLNFFLACKPNMKLSSVEGVHVHRKNKDDVDSLEISDSLFHFTQDIFEQFTSLKKIRVKASGLSTLEPPLESVNLVRLDIEGNKIDNIPSGIFAGLENLEILSLDKNDIQELVSGSFDNLLHLIELRMEDNLIKSLPERVFDSLPNLKSLSLSKNLLGSLDGRLLSQNQMLTWLRFNDNRELREVDPELLDDLTSLTFVDFRNTCVGQGSFDVATTKMRIKQHCRG